MNSLRQKINTNINDLLKDFVDREINSLENNFYIGKVVSNSDPKKLGRCQVRVYGIFDDSIPNNDLPWALPDFSFIGSKMGSFIVPPVNTIVQVYFENGDIYLPHYTTKVIDKNNPLSKNRNLGFNGDPNIMIFFASDEGEYFKIDRSKNESEYRSASGDIYTWDSNGNVTISTTSVTSPLGGNITINCKNTVTINALIVKIPHNTIGAVTPDATGGPFCSLQFDPLTGVPHQGTTLTNI